MSATAEAVMPRATASRRTSAPVVLAIMHPKGGVGRSTTVWHLGVEFALRQRRVVLEDLDQAQHLSAAFAQNPIDLRGLQLGAPSAGADLVLLDTAPEADRPRAIRHLQRADWVLVPVKGPEQASVQALPLLMDWVREAGHAGLLAFLPTMHKTRRASSRHQRFLLAEQLAHLDALDQLIARISAQIAERVRPVEEVIERLDAISGVGAVAEVLVAEVGTDMSRFPSAAHLASWAGVCPGNNESAGKRKSGRIRRGSPWLRAALVDAAHAVRTKDTYLGAQFRRLASRRGAKKASVAVAHSILVAVYHLLEHNCPSADLGTNYFDERARDYVARRLVQRLQGLGYRVVLDPLTPPGVAA